MTMSEFAEVGTSQGVGEPCESYRLLAATLAPPTHALVSLLHSDPKLPLNRAWLAQYPDDGDLLEALEEEYTRLFVNAFPQLEAPPFAAIYLSPQRPERLLAQIEERLMALGLAPAGSRRERFDHISVLLEAAGRTGDPTARTAFVVEFLAPWLATYEQRLQQIAELPLYPELVTAAIDLISTELLREER